MVVILLDVSENLFYNIFNVKDDSVWFLTLCNDNENITWKEPSLYFGFMGGSILMKDLVRPKHFGGPTVSLTYHVSLLKQQCLMKLFLCKLCFYQSPSAFYFFQIVVLVFWTWYACRRVVANI